MKVTVRSIGKSEYQEVGVDEIESGTLDKREAIKLAQEFISAAEDLLWTIKKKRLSDECGSIVEELNQCS